MKRLPSWIRNIAASLAFIVAGSTYACDITLTPGSNQIQNALNTYGVHSVCLSPGNYTESAGITVNAGQLLIGTGNTDDAKIISSAQYPIELLAGATVARMNIEGAPGFLPDFGVIVGAVSGATAWGLRIQKTNIGLGTNGASNVSFLANDVSQNGVGGDGIAQPSIWINSSSSVSIQWGEIYGDSANGGGDGEIGVYNSTGVSIDAVYVNWSGASGIYMVNCDSCSVTNSFIRYAGEYGLDIVGGSNSFYANNNEIDHTHYGSVVYEDTGSDTATFTNNKFLFPGTPGCAGVKMLAGNPANVSMSGNYIQSGWIYGYADVKC